MNTNKRSSNKKFMRSAVAVFMAVALVFLQFPFSWGADAVKQANDQIAAEQSQGAVNKDVESVAVAPDDASQAAKPDASKEKEGTPANVATEQPAASNVAANNAAPEQSKPAPRPSSFTFEDAQKTVVVELSDPNALPEGAKLVVTDVNSGNEYNQAVSKLEDYADGKDKVVSGYAVLDIRFELNGKEVELAGGTAQVSVTFKNAVDVAPGQGASAEDVSVIHMEEKAGGAVDPVDVTKRTETAVDGNGAVKSVGMFTSSFSLFVVAVMSDGASLNINFEAKGVDGSTLSNYNKDLYVVMSGGWGKYLISQPLQVKAGKGSVNLSQVFETWGVDKLVDLRPGMELDVVIGTLKDNPQKGAGGYYTPDSIDQFQNGKRFWDGDVCYAVTAPEGTLNLKSGTNNADVQLAQQDVKIVVDSFMDLKDVIGNSRYYGIVTNKWFLAEAETNAAAKIIDAGRGQQSGNDLTAGRIDKQPWVIGQMDNGKFVIKGGAAKLYATSDVINVFKADSGSTPKGSEFVVASSSAINTYVDNLMSVPYANSAAFVGKQSFKEDASEMMQGNKLKVDLSGKPDGTYYLNMDSVIDKLQAGDLQIIKSDKQTIVFNITKSGTVGLQKFECVLNGKTIGSDATYSVGEPVAKTVVWNMPNASEVNFDGSVLGLVIAPKATVNIKNTSGGWLIADTVYSAAGEWHNIWQSYEDDWPEVGALLNAHKTLQGRTLKAGEFSFELREGNTVLQTKTNDASGNVAFDDLVYKEPGVHTYTVSEVKGSDSTTTYDNRIYTATVTVKATEDKKLVATVEYSYDGAKVDIPEFLNQGGKSEPTSAVLNALKELNGRTLKAGEFSFTLNDGSQDVQTKENAADGTVTFDAIEYDEAGTYEYTITEVKGSEPGVTYDGSVKKATVVVTDEGGKLKADVKYESKDWPKFVNEYNPSPTNAVIEATKVLNGRTLKAGEFTFALNDGSKDIQTVANGADGKVKFQPITYLEAGTYTYKISEVKGSLPGVTYDPSVKDVTVTVTDQDGALKAKVDYGQAGKAQFTNEYKPAPTSASFEAEKVLKGRDLKAGEFSFQLSDTTGLLQTKANDDKGKVAFDAITYEAAGVYAYTISEVEGSLPGVTYDPSVKDVTVTVTDEGGALKAQVSYGKAGKAQFTNEYKPAPTSASFEAEKVLKGRDLKAGEFSFALSGASGVIQVKGNDADGKVAFDAVEYDKVGTYEYTVSEVKGSEPGVTYDPSVKKVTVTVTDEGGKLKADVKYENNAAPKFTNEYKPAPASAAIQAEKVLKGRTLKADEFSFALNDGSKDIQTKANDAEGKVKFDAISYEAAGTYSYTISEVKGSLPGVTYDPSVKDVTVTVTDEGGVLKAQVSYGQEGKAQFTNEYKPEPASAFIQAEKVLKGRTLKAGEFSFQLSDASGALQTKANDVDGKVAFDAIGYTKAGTYAYTISEVQGQAADITYDPSVKDVTVTVTDEGGKLSVDVSYGEEGKAQFANEYKPAPTSAVIKAEKALTGRTLKAGEFSFQLSDTSGALQTVANDADGKVAFEAIGYDKAGTYEYTISEVKGSLPSVTYDPSVKKATVTVTDEGGKLKADVTYEDGAVPTFANEYKPTPTSASIQAAKALDGRDLKAGEFSFQLSDASGVLQVRENDDKGKVAFDAIEYDQAGTYAYTISEVQGSLHNVTYDPSVKDVTVTVTDHDGVLTAQVDYGQEVLPVFTNTYVPDASIQLELGKAYFGLKDGNFTFTLKAMTKNGETYVPRQGEGSITPSPEGVYADDGVTPMTVSTTVQVASGKTVAITFPTFTFAKAGDYYYAISEDGSSSHAGWDKGSYLAHVSVTEDRTAFVEYLLDAGEGYEEASDEPCFYNNDVIKVTGYGLSDTYFTSDESEEEIWIDPKVNKQLIGAPLQEGQFTFGLYELVPDGKGGISTNLVTTATNDAMGVVDFDKAGGTLVNGKYYLFRYTQPGDHWFSIVELPGSSASIVYDQTTIYVNINVFQTQNGLDYTEKFYDALKDGKEITNPTFVNKVKGYDLKVKKTDKATGKALAGATYGLYMVNDGAAGNDALVAQSAASDADGWMLFSNVNLDKASRYYLAEISAPAGYVVNPHKTATFTFQDLKPQESSAENQMLVYEQGVSDETATISFTKLDQQTHEYVAGATLAIIDQATGKELARWNTAQSAQTFNRQFADGVPLVVDKDYLLREVSAPQGYSRAADTVFHVDAHGVVSIVKGPDAEANDGGIVLYDAKASVPNVVNHLAKTGDLLPIILWVVVACVAAAAVVVGFVGMRRGKKDEE